MDNVVLHVADVHKSFAGLHALSDIDLSNLIPDMWYLMVKT